jgi:protein tyrosine phosphatase (PTP) superfamily phosphohydrolase (DUF442 family)
MERRPVVSCRGTGRKGFRRLAQVDEIHRKVKSGRARWYLRAVVPTAIVLVVVIFRNPLFHKNFGVVEPARVYRSAQPDADFPRLIERYGLATILNLRGGSQADSWYAAEVRATREHGVDFYDLPMSATRRPRRRELLTLLELFESCRYPLLIHCKSGSDRTGLATALYRMYRNGEPPEEAMRAFSLSYGHVPIGGPEHLHEPLREYGAWLKEHRWTHDPGRLRAWIEQVYASDEPRQPLPPLHPGPRKSAPEATPVAQPSGPLRVETRPHASGGDG